MENGAPPFTSWISSAHWPQVAAGSPIGQHRPRGKEGWEKAGDTSQGQACSQHRQDRARAPSLSLAPGPCDQPFWALGKETQFQQTQQGRTVETRTYSRWKLQQVFSTTTASLDLHGKQTHLSKGAQAVRLQSAMCSTPECWAPTVKARRL